MNFYKAGDFKVIKQAAIILTLVMMFMVNSIYPQTNNYNLVKKQSMKKDGSVLLPSEQPGYSSDYISAEDFVKTDAIEEFRKKHGDWTLQYDKAANTPHFAFGKSIQIDGYSRITEDNVEEAAMKFIRENADVMNLDPDNPELVRTTHVRNRWYVSYKQVHEGIDVLLSEIELRIYDNAKVMAFGVDYYNEIDIDTKPTVSYETAVNNAAKGFDNKTKRSAIFSNDPQDRKVYIIPVKYRDDYTCKLVYKVKVASEDPTENFVSYVDAHEGDVVWRYNTVSEAMTDVHASGGIKMTNPTDPETVENFANMYVNIGGEQHTTDENGNLQVDVTEATDVIARLEGPWVNVKPEDRQKAQFSGQLNPGSELGIEWTDNNSHRYERNMFFHTNYIHDYMKNIDPDLDAIDKQICVMIQFNGQMVNAMSMGDTIRFLGANSTDMLLADGPAILYHEYGHSINTLMYKSLGKGEMNNMACQEGTADFTAASLLDEPGVGVGVFAVDPDSVIRNLDNNNVYPEDISGESHHDGQILGGAFWDLRKLTSTEIAMEICHFARYGTPDDPDNGTAFSEWFVESIIADDDDGNISNGSPHYEEIVEAFGKHKIGLGLFQQNAFKHDPLPNTQETSSSYIVEFDFGAMSLPNSLPDSLAVVYSTDNFETSHTVMAEQIDNYNYSAPIPPQDKGTIVWYYVRGVNKVNEEEVRFTAQAKSSEPYVFLVGYQLAHSEDFEQETGWKIGADDDDATTGIWERENPEEVNLSQMMMGGLIQPGDDHTEDGSYCFVTGSQGGFNFYQHALMRGKTSVISPTFDISAAANPLITFYRWFAVLSLGQMGSSEDKPYWIVSVSGDNGDTWITIDSSTATTDEWQKNMLVIPDEVNSSKKFKIKFAAVNSIQSTFPPLAEALFDDFEILSANDGIVSSVDVYKTGNNDLITCCPNPFTDNIKVRLGSINSMALSVSVYNMMGEKVKTLNTADSYMSNLTWDGTNQNGKKLPSGVYFIRITTDNKVISRQVIKN